MEQISGSEPSQKFTEEDIKRRKKIVQESFSDSHGDQQIRPLVEDPFEDGLRRTQYSLGGDKALLLEQGVALHRAAADVELNHLTSIAAAALSLPPSFEMARRMINAILYRLSWPLLTVPSLLEFCLFHLCAREDRFLSKDDSSYNMESIFKTINRLFSFYDHQSLVLDRVPGLEGASGTSSDFSFPDCLIHDPSVSDDDLKELMKLLNFSRATYAGDAGSSIWREIAGNPHFVAAFERGLDFFRSFLENVRRARLMRPPSHEDRERGVEQVEPFFTARFFIPQGQFGVEDPHLLTFFHGLATDPVLKRSMVTTSFVEEETVPTGIGDGTLTSDGVLVDFDVTPCGTFTLEQIKGRLLGIADRISERDDFPILPILDVKIRSNIPARGYR